MAGSHVFNTRWIPACVLMGDNSNARIKRRKEPGQVQSTKPTATSVAVLFLCCYTAARVPVNLADSCFPSGPESCSFETARQAESNVTGGTTCSWVSVNFRFLKNDVHVYLQLEPGQQEGRLTSRTGCRQTSPGCLKFLYFFDVNDTIDLSVAVHDDGYDDVRMAQPEATAVWTTSSSRFDGWSEAMVPITTSAGDFRVVFKAERRRGLPGQARPSGSRSRFGSVYLDDIRYGEEGQTRCTLGPLVAVTTPPPSASPRGSSTSSGLAVAIPVGVVIVVAASVIVAVVTRLVIRAVLRRVAADGDTAGSSLNSQELSERDCLGHRDLDLG